MPPAILPVPTLAPQSKDDVAALLKVSVGYLKVALRNARRYTVFHIPKKRGGAREIAAPTPTIKQLQDRLLPVFESLYHGRSPTFGFVKGRSIKSNASPHVKSRFVLNVDLQDFFPSIHFGRIRGLLRGKPYFFGAEASRVIADLCCRTGVLPQGAPTSPILSNMICGKLDAELKALAKKYHCAYTRYADDITFSTKARSFPAGLAHQPTETDNQLRLGSELADIITKNGFLVNDKKIRLTNRRQRHEVTGLTVNEFPNVQRRFVRQVRAMLHAWKKYGLAKAQSEFIAKYDSRHRKSSPPSFARVVKGKIEFIGQIRGEANPLYWRLLRQYALLNGDLPLKEPPTFIEFDIAEVKKALWVLIDKSTYSQCTAFMLRGFGLVTCDHGIHDPAQLYAFQSRDPLRTEYHVAVESRDQKLDLAVLTPSFGKSKALGFGDDSAIKQLDPIRLVGFPQHHDGADVSIHEGQLVNEYRFENLRRFHISPTIIQGNSGGPVLNSQNQVIGVAIKGGAGELNAVVPISYLLHLPKFRKQTGNSES
jgi:RNA-directed DNA polymerase